MQFKIDKTQNLVGVKSLLPGFLLLNIYKSQYLIGSTFIISINFEWKSLISRSQSLEFCLINSISFERLEKCSNLGRKQKTEE
jgi:hypothetical protein